MFTIDRGGRISNPVPGSAGPKTGDTPDDAEPRRIWSAELMPDFSWNAMETQRVWFEDEGLERESLLEQGIFG